MDPFPIGVPLMPTSCQVEEKNKKCQTGQIPDHSMQARKKSRPITVGVNVLIHWSNVVTIQFDMLRSGPEIMRFLCTWWLHRAASQKQKAMGLLFQSTLVDSHAAVRGILKKTQSFDPGGLGKSLAFVICFESNYFPSHTLCLQPKEEYDWHKGSIQQKFSVYGGAHLTANVLKSGRNVVTFLYLIMRELWNYISLIICRLFYYLCHRKRLCDSHGLFVWLWRK